MRGRANSRALAGTSQTFVVDLADRVTSVGPSVATYRNDGYGRRTSVTKASTTTVQVYSQAGQLLYQSSPASDGIFRSGFQSSDTPYPASTGGNKRYVYLGRHLIAEDGTTGRSYIHTDGLGSPARTTNASGVPSGREDYKPYGWGPTPQSEPGFTGHVADAETGLSYMQARYYDPFAGRFLALDPVGASATSFNRYWYGNNNPYRFIDPDGREGCAASRIGAVCERYGMSNAASAAIQERVRHAPKVALDTATAPWHGWDGFTDAGACIWKCGLPGDGSITAQLAALPVVPVVGRVAVAERQIAAAWGSGVYRHGGLMMGIEHIMYRHGFNSGFAGVSRFAQGTRARDISNYVDSALRYGTVTATSPQGYMVEYNLGRAIGTNVAGNAASNIRVFVEEGIIRTAFPF